MALEVKRMIPRGNESITIYHESVERPLDRGRVVNGTRRASSSPSGEKSRAGWKKRKRERKREIVRASVRDRIGLIWIRTIVVPDARTLRCCRCRMRLMTRKFKNRDPVGRPTPTPPSLFVSISISLPWVFRWVHWVCSNSSVPILIDRSRFVSAKLILNALGCSMMPRTHIWLHLNHSRRDAAGVRSRRDSTVTALSGR